MDDITSYDYGNAFDLGGGAGPNSDGTFNVPLAAQPTNQPWDIAGGQSGQYGSAVMDILKYGIGAWSSTRQTQNMLDYRRFEATNGGTFQQGQAANVQAVQRQNSLIPLLLIGGLIFILVKA